MHITNPTPPNLTRLGTLRTYYLAVVIFFCAFLNGYDSGVAGSILTYKPFEEDFHYGKARSNQVKSLTVSLQQLGAFVACFVVFPAADRYGRKICVIVSAAVFIAATIVQTINTGSLSAWYVVRLISGMGQGGLTVVVPSYCVEMAPKEIRGRLGSFYQWMYTWGVFLSYWVGYGVKKNLPPTSRQWQLPVGLQLVSAAILLLGMLTLPESVRFLVANGRDAEAWSALTWVRGVSSSRSDDTNDTHAAAVRDEFREIQSGIAAEQAARAGLTLRELLTTRTHLKRFGLGTGLFLFQQATGSTALAYFGPQFFSLVTGNDADEALLLTALFGAVKVAACTFFIVFLAERLSRRVLLAGGALAMAACMLPTALVLRYEPTVIGGNIGAYGGATVALLYLNIAIYNNSWGPLPWAYVPEIFDTRTRALGMAVSSGIHWLFAFVFNISTPYMIADLGRNGWGTFLFYAAMDVVMAIFAWTFMKETRGKSLEKVHEELRVENEEEPALAEDIAIREGSDTSWSETHLRTGKKDVGARVDNVARSP